MDGDTLFQRMVAEGDLVLDRLDHAATAWPDKRYLHDGEGGAHLSFAQVKALTDRVAAGLVAMGLPPGAPVSVLTRQSRLSALAMFAIWRAGGVFAPVNFNFRGTLLAYQLEDTKPFALITDESFAPVLAEVAPRVALRRLVMHPARADEAADTAVLHDFDLTPWSTLEASTAPVPCIARAPHDVANIVYTSGTTGPSKGVVQPFRWINHYGFPSRALTTHDDVLYCDLPLYHVGGAFALLTRALWPGNTVGLWDRFSPTAFWDRVAACGASSAILLDVMIPWLMSAPPRASDRANSLNKVHMQPLPANHHAVAQRFGFDFITCGFGQTESGSGFAAAIDEWGDAPGTPPALWRGLSKGAYRARCRELGRTLMDGARSALPKGYMGQPNPVLDVAVLDELDNPVPRGQVGQLAFRPRHPHLLMQGYLNKPEVTLQVLRNCWFHTGDGVRELPELPGHYAFVDRLGGFLRVRGENVSSVEVESLIATHPAVRAVAVVPVRAAVGDEEDIAAFVEPRDGATLTEAELRAHAERELPRYMQPRHWRIVAALPVTPTNKVEKYKLKAQLSKELDDAR